MYSVKSGHVNDAVQLGRWYIVVNPAIIFSKPYTRGANPTSFLQISATLNHGSCSKACTASGEFKISLTPFVKGIWRLFISQWHIIISQQQAFMKEMEHMQLKDSLRYATRRRNVLTSMYICLWLQLLSVSRICRGA